MSSINEIVVGEARNTNVLKNILRKGLQNDPTQRPFFDGILLILNLSNLSF